ncbi:hypothetical protein DMX06_00470 [Pseudomonas mosselii]|nr:hypothetical protein DMX06_00470 [Pseudomonas mosselii]
MTVAAVRQIPYHRAPRFPVSPPKGNACPVGAGLPANASGNAPSHSRVNPLPQVMCAAIAVCTGPS